MISSNDITSADQEGPRLAPRRTAAILGAFMVVLLLATLDETIVNTALPRIISELRGLEIYAWVSTAYMLAITVMVPIFGSLGDRLGHKRLLVGGIAVFVLGSMLCGLSGASMLGDLFGGGMMQLIVFRAIQGLGGGALWTMTFATLSDLFSPRDRGRYVGLFGAMLGLAFVMGPTLGGYFTEHASFTVGPYAIEGWRWIFLVNLPLGLIAMVLLQVFLPRSAPGVHGKFDFRGAALLLLFAVPLILALTWGGNTYPWTGAMIGSLLAGSLLALGLFIFVEKGNPEAILPLGLFSKPVFSLVNVVGFLSGMSFFAVMLFMPLYMQLIQGVSPTRSGFSMLPMMGGIILASVVGGLVMSQIGRYKPVLLVAQVLLLLGVFALGRITVETTPIDLCWRMFLVGLGLGPYQTLGNVVIQNEVSRRQSGIASSTNIFCRQIGATIGLALFGTLLTHNVLAELPKHMPELPVIKAQRVGLHELYVNGDTTRMKAALMKSLEHPYAILKRAVAGDQGARRMILEYPRTPANVRQLLESGAPLRLDDRLKEKLDRGFESYATEKSQAIERSIKLSFSSALSHMLQVNVPIALLGFLVLVIMPSTRLRTRDDLERMGSD